MQEPTFEQLAAEAAAGLRGDRELYLDITQELRSHLDDKADAYARQGNSTEESIALARRAFGSPLEMAAELLRANRGRLRWRAAARLFLGALVVPVSLLLALYVGYGRFARLQAMTLSLLTKWDGAGRGAAELPSLPFFSVERPAETRGIPAASDTAGLYAYWQAHAQDSDGYVMYACYAALGSLLDKASYVETMRRGERIEPDNALYNILLAQDYLTQGIVEQGATKRRPLTPSTDRVVNHRLMEAGVTELRKAVWKPYLRSYQGQIARKHLNALPPPLLTEDYLYQIDIMASNVFPNFARYRDLARRIPACARVLLREGRAAEAEAVLDCWRPLTALVADEPQNTIIIQSLVARAVGSMLAVQVAPIYDRLGKQAKAEDARATARRLQQMHDRWRNGAGARGDEFQQAVTQHGARTAGFLYPVFGNIIPSVRELTPGRMHEHVMIEEIAVNAVLSLLALLLIGTLTQGFLWHFRLRGSDAVPLLLLPTAKQLARALLLGVIVPLAAYWLYSRLPTIGGREYGWFSEMWPRFVIELFLLAVVLLWLPAHLVRRSIRHRCDDLEIALPGKREEIVAGWQVRGAVFAALLLAAPSLVIPGDVSPILRIAGVALAVVIAAMVVRAVGRRRSVHGLYYGTVARSLVPVYALTIMTLVLLAQPWLLYQEASWLRRDTLIFGAVADRQGDVSLTALEIRAAREYDRLLMEALRKQ